MRYLCVKCHKVVDFAATAALVQCPNCGAQFPLVLNQIPIFIDNALRDANFYGSWFREEAENYDTRFHLDTSHGRWVLRRLFELEPRVRQFSGGTILEIGAGSGLLTRSLAEGAPFRYRELHVSDISPEMLAINWRQQSEQEKRANVHYSAFNVLKMPFPDGMFDMIVGFDILHHVLNYPLALSEIRRVLKSPGVCVLKEPHREAHRLYCFLIRLLFRYPGGLTEDDKAKLTVWQNHFYNLVQCEETNNHKPLAALDDKYMFSPQVLANHVYEAGFDEFSECNVLARERASIAAPGVFYAEMILDFFRSLGVSEQGLALVKDIAVDLDATVGDIFLRDYPVNTLFLFWRGLQPEGAVAKRWWRRQNWLRRAARRLLPAVYGGRFDRSTPAARTA